MKRKRTFSDACVCQRSSAGGDGCDCGGWSQHPSLIWLGTLSDVSTARHLAFLQTVLS
jgi:hypothetical protein